MPQFDNGFPKTQPHFTSGPTAFFERILMSRQSQLDPDFLNTSSKDQKDVLNAILGAAQARRKKGPRRKLNAQQLSRLRKLMALRKSRKGKTTQRSTAKKPAMRALWARLSPAKRKAMVAAMIRKNPKLKNKLTLAVLKKRIQDRKNGTVTSPGATNAVLTPQASSALVMNNPSQAPVSDQEQQTTAEAVQDEQEQASLDTASNEEAAEEEGTEEAAEENAGEMNEKAEASAEEMTEETPEEAAEEAEEATDDTAEAISESAGDLLLGYLRGKGKQRRRHHGHVRRAVNAAKPWAKEVERLSGGEIEAAHLLGAVKLIAKAKKGDVRAKKGIKALTKLAVSKHAKAPKAKKAVAKLKVAHAIMKKTGTAKGKAKKSKTPYTTKVVVRSAGLNSYSPYQRGMAMIPGFARAHFGTKA
jgi:hypothetical protein